jgi:hypothetical protein
MLVAILALSSEASAQSRATVNIRLNETLSSGSSQPGDSFTGTLDGPLVVNDRVVAEEGTRVVGQITESVSSGRLKTPAKLTLLLKTVETGRKLPMQTGDLTVKADSHSGSNLLIIGGSAALGTVIGAASGGGKGAVIGGAAGAGAGVVGAYLSGKREIVLPAETRLTFHVNSMTITPADLAAVQQPSNAIRDDRPEAVIIYRERRHGHDDDDEGADEHEHGRGHKYGHYKRHEKEYDEDEEGYERPRTIDVIFQTDHRAVVIIAWPQRVERLTLDGDVVEDILQPLAAHTRVSIEILRPKIRVKRHDD